MKISFNKPLILGNEVSYIEKTIKKNSFSGNSEFTSKCNLLLESKTKSKKSILTSSCTDALEMTALLSNLELGDEVIMPSYAFVSSASAFQLRGINIVWCDIRMDTKNIDESKIESLITSRTKAIVIVHYAGVACEMDTILDICNRNNLILVEDAAQAIDCFYKNNHLGTMGHMGTFSFHETKNIQCGEGGALLVNDDSLIQPAKFIRDKGTNRSLFTKGIVDKYTWVELGSSFLMSELQAAFLYPQLQKSKKVNDSRLEKWNLYYSLLSRFMPKNKLPFVPDNIKHNGHMFYILCESKEQRLDLSEYLLKEGISAIFHYVPLHSAPYWENKYKDISLPITDHISDVLLRLPMYYGIEDDKIQYIAEKIQEFYKNEN